jgi:hypothetical protein
MDPGSASFSAGIVTATGDIVTVGKNLGDVGGAVETTRGRVGDI